MLDPNISQALSSLIYCIGAAIVIWALMGFPHFWHRDKK